jgi:hypothetical protein
VSVRHRTDCSGKFSERQRSATEEGLRKQLPRKKQAYLAIIALIGGLISYTDSFSVWDKRVCLFIIKITLARSEFQDNTVENPDFSHSGRQSVTTMCISLPCKIISYLFVTAPTKFSLTCSILSR